MSYFDTISDCHKEFRPLLERIIKKEDDKIAIPSYVSSVTASPPQRHLRRPCLSGSRTEKNIVVWCVFRELSDWLAEP